jgi:hypothetical protein
MAELLPFLGPLFRRFEAYVADAAGGVGGDTTPRRRQGAEIQDRGRRVNPARADALAAEWWHFREDLLRKEIPPSIRDLRNQVRALPSVKALQRKLGFTSP